MLKKAVNNGASVRTGTTVVKVSKSHVFTNNDKFGYKYLIGADGSSSLVRRHLKIATKNLGTGINFQVPKKFDHMEWHLNPNKFNSGYAWIFPHKDSTSVGIYAKNNDLRPAIMKDRFQQWADNNNVQLNSCRPNAFLINSDYKGWNFGNIFLVGDAAGLASRSTGEVISPAIVSGETVAKTISDKDSKP